MEQITINIPVHDENIYTIKTLEHVNEMKTKLREEDEKIERLLKLAREQKSNLENELARLQGEELQKLLAEFFISGKETPPKDLLRVRKRIQEIKEFLSEFFFLEEGIRRLSKPIQHGFHLINRRERHIQRLERYKEAYKNNPKNQSLKDDILSLGREMKMEAEVYQFLNEIQETVSKS